MTHYEGLATLLVDASCWTSGTYDVFGASVRDAADKLVLVAINWPDPINRPKSTVLTAGRYKLQTSKWNDYAKEGCTCQSCCVIDPKLQPSVPPPTFALVSVG